MIGAAVVFQFGLLIWALAKVNERTMQFVHRIRIYLWVTLAAGAVMLMMGDKAAIRELAYASIWLAYFSWSKRVARTYGQEG